jgi:hypothetical protein
MKKRLLELCLFLGSLVVTSSVGPAVAQDNRREVIARIAPGLPVHFWCLWPWSLSFDRV